MKTVPYSPCCWSWQASMSSLQADTPSSPNIYYTSSRSTGTIPPSRSEIDGASVPNPAGTEELSSASQLLLSAAKDARQVVRFLQCQICSRIIQEPTTLPCGHSLCRSCVPQTHIRTNISWPATASRLRGFECPFADCKKEHAIGDCGVDVTLSKALAFIKTDRRQQNSP